MRRRSQWLADNRTQRLAALAKTAQVAWQGNGLRHSFISCRVAKVQNVAQVALEAGNAPRSVSPTSASW